MQINELSIPGVIEIIPAVYEDSRGYFLESFNAWAYGRQGLPTEFVQDNQSFSKQGVLRGLHFQVGSWSQGKLVRVTRGRALDVVVDLRYKSATFGKHLKVELSEQKHNMLWVPRGFAHGFLALTDCTFQYKCDNGYNQEADAGIIWNDPTLAIDWGIKDPVLSDKDAQHPLFDPTKDYFN